MLPLLAFASRALAVEPAADDQLRGESASDKPLAQYLTELTLDDDPKRLYAARVVYGTLKHDLHVVDHAHEGSIAYDDARAELVELQDRVPGACLVAVSYPNTVALCADMLAWLEVSEAREPLQKLLETETRKSVRKHLEAALATIPTKS